MQVFEIFDPLIQWSEPKYSTAFRLRSGKNKNLKSRTDFFLNFRRLGPNQLKWFLTAIELWYFSGFSLD